MSTKEPKSFNSQEVDSLLKYVKIQNIENISKNVFLISSKNSILKRTKVILEQYKEKPRIQTNIYTNISLIKYSKDGNLINSLEKMNDKELEKFLRSPNNKLLNFDSFSDDSDTKRFVLFPYGGGKQKHKCIQQKLLKELLENNPHHFKSYYEPFLGGFGSVYNSIQLILEYGIKDIYLSDVNPSLVNIYRQVQKNPKQVQRHLSSIDLEYLKTSGQLYPTSKEDGKKLFKKIHSEFTELEIKKRMNPRRAALFLYILHNTQGGMITFNIKTKLNTSSFCFCENKLKQIPLIINKVEIFNKIFNLGNIKFSIKKYEPVLKKIKNDTTSLILFDPPYVNYEEVSTSEDFLSCSYNYGINNFNHRKLLEEISNGKYSFIYYNNHNPHLESFSKSREFNYVKKDVIYKNGTVGKKCVEILMFKNRVGKEIKTVNFTNFKQIEIKQAS